MAVKLVLLVLVWLVVPRAAAKAQTTYFEIGGSLVLKPEFSDTITGITWKHNGNIVAEWIKDSVDLEYLGDLKGRTDLNLTTGTLTVKNMLESDKGAFSVEINNRVLPDTFDAVPVNNLDSLYVLVRPLTCSSASDECTLTCGDFKDIGTIQYFWKFGENGKWEEKEKVINISKETWQTESFTCKAKTAIREKESAPEKNPFNRDPTSIDIGLVVGVVIFILTFGAIVIAFIYFYMRPNKGPQWVQNILSRFRPNAGVGGPGGQTANGTTTDAAPSADTALMDVTHESEDKS